MGPRKSAALALTVVGTQSKPVTRCFKSIKIGPNSDGLSTTFSKLESNWTNQEQQLKHECKQIVDGLLQDFQD